MPWTYGNGPFYNDYYAYTFDTFLKKFSFFKNSLNPGIYVDDVLVGIIFSTPHDDSFHTVELGIIIYDDSYWHQGVGYAAMSQWMAQLRIKHPKIVRITATSWSGGFRMLALAKKLGMQEISREVGVFEWEGECYDSITMGKDVRETE
ncbi:GNAT family N-acetyltransferase [Alloscardovia venturai]|uniref:GNAT family N-acetyltransferase n=1 Tax=Alloscardovia venturai TaxID=1769421 RepID=A0ABW2Y1Q8_9BIFI